MITQQTYSVYHTRYTRCLHMQLHVPNESYIIKVKSLVNTCTTHREFYIWTILSVNIYVPIFKKRKLYIYIYVQYLLLWVWLSCLWFPVIWVTPNGLKWFLDSQSSQPGGWFAVPTLLHNLGDSWQHLHTNKHIILAYSSLTSSPANTQTLQYSKHFLLKNANKVYTPAAQFIMNNVHISRREEWLVWTQSTPEFQNYIITVTINFLCSPISPPFFCKHY